FPFVWLAYLIVVVPTAGLLGMLIYGVVVNGEVVRSVAIFCLALFGLVCFLYIMLLGILSPVEWLNNQTNIEDATKSDARLPVMFLRPFAADQWAFAFDNTPLTFEAYLRDAFWERIGPFVALGNPEDYLPRPFRTYARDEDWYAYFERLAGQMACVVMPVSNSDNLQRELTFIRRNGLQRRLFILTHIFKADRRLPFRLWANTVYWILLRLFGPPVLYEVDTWEQLAQNLGKLGFDFGADPGQGAVVTFDSEGKTKVLVKGAGTPLEF